MPTIKKSRKRKPGFDHKAAKEMLMLILVSFVPRNQIETEFRFHPPRRWRFDYVLNGPIPGSNPPREYKIAIEFNGSVWTQGRHTRGQGYINDREKINQAQIDGWLVLELTTEMIKSGRAYEMIEQAIESRKGGNECQDN